MLGIDNAIDSRPTWQLSRSLLSAGNLLQGVRQIHLGVSATLKCQLADISPSIVSDKVECRLVHLLTSNLLQRYKKEVKSGR